MKLYTLDASAWLRLFLADGPLPAGFETAAVTVSKGNAAFVSPELILVEAAHALHRKREKGLLTARELADLWGDMRKTPLNLLAIETHVDTALELAGQFKLSAYDALYLAVARHAGAPLFTADDKLCAAARRLDLAAGD